MNVKRPSVPPGTRALASGLLAFAVTALPAAAWAAPLGGWHGSAGLLAGSVLPDRALSDYQWDTTARPTWGAQVLAGLGPLDAGVRMLTAETTQDLGISGVETPKAQWTTWEFVGQVRLVEVWGTALHAIGSVGQMRLRYTPDRLSFDPGGGSPPVEVELQPVDEWIGGGGVAVKRGITRHWTVGLELDHRVFSMDTAHRNGSAIEYRRESFREWNGRLELAWTYGRN